MYTFLMAVHVSACLFLILVVLLQAGRGAGLSVFGGSGGDILATPSGTSFMKQLTGWIAATFAVTSLLLAILSGRAGIRSVTSTVSFPAAPAKQAGSATSSQEPTLSSAKTPASEPASKSAQSGAVSAQPAAPKKAPANP